MIFPEYLLNTNPSLILVFFWRQLWGKFVQCVTCAWVYPVFINIKNPGKIIKYIQTAIGEALLLDTWDSLQNDFVCFSFTFCWVHAPHQEGYYRQITGVIHGGRGGGAWEADLQRFVLCLPLRLSHRLNRKFVWTDDTTQEILKRQQHASL